MVSKMELPGIRNSNGCAALFKGACLEANQRRSLPTISFSQDGKLLAYATGARTVGIFRLDPESLRQLACQKAGRNLSRAEWDKYIGDAFPYEDTCGHF
jgi:hypothetical protein